MPELHIHIGEDDTTGNGVILIPELNLHLVVVKNADSSPNHTSTVAEALCKYYQDWGYRAIKVFEYLEEHI